MLERFWRPFWRKNNPKAEAKTGPILCPPGDPLGDGPKVLKSSLKVDQSQGLGSSYKEKKILPSWLRCPAEVSPKLKAEGCSDAGSSALAMLKKLCSRRSCFN